MHCHHRCHWDTNQDCQDDHCLRCGLHSKRQRNQGHLYEDIHDLFEDDRAYNFEGAPYSYAKTVDKDHGRIEIRQSWTISDPEYLANIRDLKQWEGVKTLAMTLSERRIGDKVEVQECYFITSLGQARLTSSSRPNAAIGELKIVCIGCWILPSTKIIVGCVRIMLLKTLPS